MAGYEAQKVSEHWGGRNLAYILRKDGENRYVLRISITADREEEQYLAETEFVHYLSVNGANVVDVVPSVNGRLAERIIYENKEAYVCLFTFAKGMLISDNGYRYVEGAPLSEYFYNTGKVLGKIHQLSKSFTPKHKRPEYFDKYNAEYLDELIPDDYKELKAAIFRRLDSFKRLSKTSSNYGLVHFDFSDGNYHIDMNTGDITVFDFDNCMYCWYMFDLANLWTHGVGWFWDEEDKDKRAVLMQGYFDTIVAGYRSETEISPEELSLLSLFIDMVLIENIVDEFECCHREGREPDDEDIQDDARCLIEDISFADFCQ